MRIHRLLATNLLLALSVLSLGTQAQPQPDVIRAEIKGLRSDLGQVGCALFSTPNGFPAKWERAARTVFVPIGARMATCEFASLPGGTYALAVFHDENNNGQMDRTFVGAPAEGHGASRDPKPGFMSPPKFENARFAYAGGTLTVQIPIHY